MTFEEWFDKEGGYDGSFDTYESAAEAAWDAATCNANLQVEQLEGEVENYVTIISRFEDKLAAVNSKLTPDHIADVSKMIPEGYVLVPVEPSKEIVVAGADEIEGVVILKELHNAYKAMIAAAQEEE